MQACTIIAKNYVAYARVLARSFARHHPDGRFWTLIIDDFEGRIEPDQEPFEVLSPSDIDCEPFIHMAMRYSVLELSTAVKPWLLRHLMRETGAPITYLDPDIKIYSALTALDERAAEAGVVLIPHNSTPIPPDGRKPSQVDIMIAGTYNLGYLSLAPTPEVDELLDWWADRLRRDCRVDPRWGYFVDQRWFDLAPGFLSDVAIVREPEYNVAYWNLHSRRLSAVGDGYSVDGRPLAFFHFSGFDPDRPLMLSRYQDRIDVVADPVLEHLLAQYAAEVLDQGHAASKGWPYSYAALGDGTRIDDTMRSLYDQFADQQNGGALSPFTLAGAKAFEGWLAAPPADTESGLGRVLSRVYQDRPELQRAYPDPTGVDRAALMEWAETYGRDDIPMLNGPAAAGRRAPEAEPWERTGPALGEPWGVNVVGYFRSELGTGEAARQVVKALDAHEIPVVPIHGSTVPVSRQGHEYQTALPDEAPYPVNLICMNADMLPEFATQVGQEFFGGRYSIGLWFWEVSRFPRRWSESFSLLEEVWAPTEHIATALAPLAQVPVNTIRLPVAPSPPKPRSRAQLGLPEGRFVFLFNFDYLSVFKRKNPLAVIEAFGRAFEPGEGPQLVLKCINHERDPSSHALLREAAAQRADVTVIDRYMAPEDNNGLTAQCDCYVSLHRAEGFGLGMAEAMWHGKPVIATGYSGNLDYMTADNSLLVAHRLVPIGPGAGPYPADGEWAEPDTEHAAALMRQVFDDPRAAAELGTSAASDIRRTHSPAAAGEIMYRRLEAIRATGRPRHTAPRRHTRSSALASLPLRIRQGPGPAPSGPALKARKVLRKLVLRGIRPFSRYQESVNEHILAAIEGLSDEIGMARRESTALWARTEAELRRAEAEQQETHDPPG